MRLNDNIVVLTDPPPGVGKQTFRNVVSGALMAYQLHNRDPKNRTKTGGKTLPSVEDISKFCRTPQHVITKCIASDQFLIAMRERGIYWDARDSLSPEQVYCIGIMTDPSSKQDMAGKLRKAGITMSTYRMWLKQPLFARAIRQIGEDMLGEHIADVNTAVVKSAIDGNMKAVEIYNQMTGRHDPAARQVSDLQALVGQLLEIIFRYVTDTRILQNITTDFEKTMSGEIVEAELVMDTPPNDTEFDAAASIPADRGDTASAADTSGEVSQVDSDSELPPGFFDFQEEIKEFDI